MKPVVTLAALCLLLPLVALAVSTVTDVTPANIAALSVKFRVEQMPHGDGLIGFEVCVSPDSGGVSDSCEGHFMLYKDNIQARSGIVFRDHASRPQKVADCSVKPENDKGLMCFRFQVHQELVARAAFRFVIPDPSGPAIDSFEMILGEFVKK